MRRLAAGLASSSPGISAPSARLRFHHLWPASADEVVERTLTSSTWDEVGDEIRSGRRRKMNRLLYMATTMMRTIPRGTRAKMSPKYFGPLVGSL